MKWTVWWTMCEIKLLGYLNLLDVPHPFWLLGTELITFIRVTPGRPSWHLYRNLEHFSFRQDFSTPALLILVVGAVLGITRCSVVSLVPTLQMPVSSPPPAWLPKLWPHMSDGPRLGNISLPTDVETQAQVYIHLICNKRWNQRVNFLQCLDPST